MSPHVPESSPVTGSAKPRSDEYAVVMKNPYCVFKTDQPGVCAVLTFCQFAVSLSSIKLQ
jgi:hypothetical protein